MQIADNDEFAQNKPSFLDLHCLQIFIKLKGLFFFFNLFQTVNEEVKSEGTVITSKADENVSFVDHSL